MGTADIEDIRERLAGLEGKHSETATLVAVLVREMEGIRWLLRMILGTIIIAVLGAVVTAWVQIPRGEYQPTAPKAETPK